MYLHGSADAPLHFFLQFHDRNPVNSIQSHKVTIQILKCYNSNYSYFLNKEIRRPVFKMLSCFKTEGIDTVII